MASSYRYRKGCWRSTPARVCAPTGAHAVSTPPTATGRAPLRGCGKPRPSVRLVPSLEVSKMRSPVSRAGSKGVCVRLSKVRRRRERKECIFMCPEERVGPAWGQGALSLERWERGVQKGQLGFGT